MMNKTIVSLAAVLLFVAGCATKAPAPMPAPATAAAPAKPASTATAEQAQSAIAAAEKSEAAAAAVDYEWVDTGNLIKEAKEAAAAGDYDKAVSLANQAERQGELAVKQEATEAAKMKNMK